MIDNLTVRESSVVYYTWWLQPGIHGVGSKGVRKQNSLCSRFHDLQYRKINSYKQAAQALSGWWDRWRYVWDRWRHMRICGDMMHAEGERLIVRYLVTPLCVACNAFALLPLFCTFSVTSKNDPGNWYHKILQARLRRYIIPCFALPFPAAACHKFSFGSWIRKNSQEKTDILSHWMSIQFQERRRAWVSLDDAQNRHGSCTVTLLAILPQRSSLPLRTATIAAPALHLVQNLKCFQKEMIIDRGVWFFQKTSLWFLEVERFIVVEVMIVVVQGCCCLRFHADLWILLCRLRGSWYSTVQQAYYL
jgi:hypothetical protein